MIPVLEPHPNGTILSVRAHPSARKNEICGVHAGMLKVSVTQAPEKGKANKALISLLAKNLVLRKSQIEILSGQTSTQKRFLIHNLIPSALADRLRLLLEP